MDTTGTEPGRKRTREDKMNRCKSCNEEITGCREVCHKPQCERKLYKYDKAISQIVKTAKGIDIMEKRAQLIEELDMKGLK